MQMPESFKVIIKNFSTAELVELRAWNETSARSNRLANQAIDAELAARGVVPNESENKAK